MSGCRPAIRVRPSARSSSFRQVTGRAGRFEKPGRAMLQTWQPDHPVIRALVSGEGERFYAEETRGRERASLPPFGRLAAIIVSGPDFSGAQAHARALARAAFKLPPSDRWHLAAAGGVPRDDETILLGPAEAPIAVLSGRHRFRLLVKAPPPHRSAGFFARARRGRAAAARRRESRLRRRPAEFSVGMSFRTERSGAPKPALFCVCPEEHRSRVRATRAPELSDRLLQWLRALSRCPARCFERPLLNKCCTSVRCNFTELQEKIFARNRPSRHLAKVPVLRHFPPQRENGRHVRTTDGWKRVPSFACRAH